MTINNIHVYEKGSLQTNLNETKSKSVVPKLIKQRDCTSKLHHCTSLQSKGRALSNHKTDLLLKTQDKA